MTNTTLTTTSFKTTMAQQFLKSVQEEDNIYYVYAGQSDPWLNESMPPQPLESQNQVFFDTWDNMLFGVIIANTNVNLMLTYNAWTTNTVYAQYDDQDTNLLNKPFFVAVNANTTYDVFKCLFNNGNVASTISPSRAATTEADPFYFTSDGYQWKYLFSVPSTTQATFATSSYMPYIPNANTTGNATPGEITTILIANNGSNYNSYANGNFQAISVGGNNLIFTIDPSSAANSGFYNGCGLKIVSGTGKGQLAIITDYFVSGLNKDVIITAPFVIQPDFTSGYQISPLVTITGNGTGALARAIVNPNSNTLASIEIVNTGTGYFWANAVVTANTGMINANTNTAIIANTAVLRVIIGPPGGHGSNLPQELGMYNIGVAVTFANNESQTIPANSKFRTFGILQSPMWANVVITYATPTGTFTEGELVTQANTGASGYVTSINTFSSQLGLTNVNGIFITSNSLDIMTGATSSATAYCNTITINGEVKGFTTFDQRERLSVTTSGGTPVSQNETINQNTLVGANATVNEANTTFIGVVNLRGIFSAGNTVTGANSGITATVNSVLPGDLIFNSGETLFIDNIQAVQRSANTSENIQIVIGF